MRCFPVEKVEEKDLPATEATTTPEASTNAILVESPGLGSLDFSPVDPSQKLVKVQASRPLGKKILA